jgi:rarD protein
VTTPNTPAPTPHSDQRHAARGLAFGLGAYAWWGAAVPLYFGLMADNRVPALEVFAQRVVFGLPLLLALLWWTSRLPAYRAAFGWRSLRWLLPSTVLIAINWYAFIYSIDRGRLSEASFGYYINPLVSVALGMLFLGERARPLQWVAIALALGAVSWLGWTMGTLPWISLTVALSFGLYGLLRKRAHADAPTGLAVEMTLLVPLMAGIYIWLFRHGAPRLGAGEHAGPLWLQLAMIPSGAVTVIPLVWFTIAARRLKLMTMGLLQYLAPTGQLLLAVLVRGEAFDRHRVVAFAVIWAALALYTVDALRGHRAQRRAARGMTELAE